MENASLSRTILVRGRRRVFASTFPFLLACLFWLLVGTSVAKATTLVTYPGPAGVVPSPDFSVTANGTPVFIYTTAVLRGGPASFGYFDFDGTVSLGVVSTRPVQSAVLKPLALGLRPVVQGNTISFDLTRPCNVTLEINGDYARPLSLFANPLEVGAPQPGDPHVLYFGPGVHEVDPTRIQSNTTIYLAGGALLQPKLMDGERPLNARDWAGMPNYPNLFQIRRAKNVTIRGRGILDMHLLPWHARKPFDVVNSSDIRFEGIIILDSPDWDINLLDCENVEVDNVKEICAREESDGIDVCDCDHVTIRGCFLRNNDDEICLKTLIPGDSEVTKNVDVSDCVIWNDRARALCIGGGETRADIHDVTFHDCDVIHDLGNWSTLAVLVCDSGRVSNIRFERIRVEDTPHKLMWCLIPVDAAVNHRGQIDGITFQDISAPGAPPSELGGFDAEHLVANVDFENIQLGGHPMASLSDGHFAVNQFVTGTEIDGAPAR